jgi:hypothetical protein
MHDLNECLSGQATGRIEVPRDPAALIDKAQANRFRRADDPERSCYTCDQKVGVPWLWCEHVGRQAEKDKVCDKWHTHEPMEG